MIAVCELCGNEYTTFRNWYNRAKHHTCSRKCADSLKKKLSVKQCLQCGKDYHKKSHQKDSKFCSEECQHNASVKKVELVCEICGTNYEVNPYRKATSRFCSNTCLRKYTGKLASERTGDKHPGYKGYKDIRRTDKCRLRTWSIEVKRRDRACTKCGSVEKLEAHHIKSYEDHPSLRFDLENGITLCGNCHALVHEKDEITFRVMKHKLNEKA